MFIVNWWNAMTAAQHGFLYVAVPATLVLVIQTLLLMFGIGDSDGDVPDGDIPDVDVGDGNFQAVEDFSNCDVSGDLDGDLRIFTVRGMVAFFSVFGWSGAAILGGGLPLWFSVVGAVVAGAAAMLAVAFIVKFALNLQQSGNINPRNAVGKSGTVYITVPPARSGSGKVNLVLQERYSEMEAVTDGEQPISPGREVTVVGTTTMGTLIVREK